MNIIRAFFIGIVPLIKPEFLIGTFARVGGKRKG